MKRYVMSAMVAAVLGLMAWPVMDEPQEPAVEFVHNSVSQWARQHAQNRNTWAGDEQKRNSILMSAVWRAEPRR